jgi:hypothetical protein
MQWYLPEDIAVTLEGTGQEGVVGMEERRAAA